MLTGLALLSIASTVLTLFLLPKIPGTAIHGSPAALQLIMLINGLLYAAIAGVGIWWLIYFSRRSVREAFTPVLAVQPGSSLYAPGQMSAGPPPPFAGPAVVQKPVFPTVLGIIYLLAGAGGVLGACLPLPLFLFSFLLHGLAARALYLALGVVGALIGWGLMRFDNRARLALYAFLALGMVNLGFMVTPSGQARFMAYNQEVMNSLRLPQAPAIVMSPAYLTTVLIFSAISGLILNGLIVYMLERNRSAFARSA